MSKQNPAYLWDHDVRVRAYHIWEREGRPEGQAEAFWLRAIAELEAERAAKAAPVDQVPPHPGVSNPPNRTVADTIAKKD